MADDKKLHMTCGFCIALFVGVYSPKLGLMAGMAAGIAKEIYDYFSYGVFDKMDMLATWAGAAIGAALAWGILQI